MKHFKGILAELALRGYLKKEEIQNKWGLSDAEYAKVAKELRAERGVELRPGGGFQLVLSRRSATSEVSPPPVSHLEAWQRDAIARLTALLQYKELEDLLGDFIYAVRVFRKVRTGQDRRGSKEELAHAIVLRHSIDLFRERQIRSLVGRRCGVKDPARWCSGKQAALEFVRAVGFPEEFAGIASPDLPSDIEYLEPRSDMRALEDFQDEVKHEVLKLFNQYGGRGIVTLPTGAGKTRVAVEAIRDWLTSRFRTAKREENTVLWLAHSGELCEQAYMAFRDVWQASPSVCPLLLCRFWARFTQDLALHKDTLSDMVKQPFVLVSTPNRIINLMDSADPREREVLADILATTSLIVVDEAHRAGAPTYKRILGRFRQATASLVVTGLTATPFRKEYDSDPETGTVILKELFENLIEAERTLGTRPREVLQDRGILARPVYQTVKTQTRLDPPPEVNLQTPSDEEIERIDKAYNLSADNAQRRLLVLEHILPICQDPDSAVLYFGPSVLDAECMALLLAHEGIKAGVVSGETRDVTRRQIVQDFRERRIKVLCNCEVLTTGFDAPRVTHVVMARPTVSAVLYEQMVGRGLRGPVFGGTDRCVIIDCEDNCKAERPRLGYHAFRSVWHPHRFSDDESVAA